jgi:hypothetical protein
MTVLPNGFSLAEFVRLSPTTGGVVPVEQDDEQSKGERLTTMIQTMKMTALVHDPPILDVITTPLGSGQSPHLQQDARLPFILRRGN